MKRTGLFWMGIFFTTIGAVAQRNIIQQLQTEIPGQGKVVIYQSDEIAKLLGTGAIIMGVPDYLEMTGRILPEESRKTIKARGYRIQVYAGNNSRRAREEASRIGARIKDAFPDIPVYTYFQSPRWLCRVGDFKSIEEADEAMRRLKKEGGYKEVSIVKEQINLPVE